MKTKVALIMGRGVEGCGVTKFTLEQYDWLERNGYDPTIYALKDKSWSRKKSHETDHVKLVRFNKIDEVSDLIIACNECDLVFIESLPPKSLKENVLKAFNRFLNDVTTSMALIQHDHSSLSIKRNGCLDEAIKRANVIFAHSETNDFAEYAKELLGSGGLSSFFDEEVVQILTFQPGMSFHRDTWLDLAHQDVKHHKWIGRTTSWKGYKQMFDFHAKHLQKYGALTTMEGIERSPAYLGFRELTEFIDHVATGEEIADADLTDCHGDLVHVFGPYVQADMLDRMRRVGFGYQLSLLKPKFIHRSIEYTHCELVCAGTIPVFRKPYGELCKHRATGRPLIEHGEDTGTVWLDEDDMTSTFETIKRLTECSDLREKWRNNAYEFYRQHQDAEYTFKEIMDKTQSALS